MILKADSSKVRGFARCNNFTGNYQLKRHQKIRFSNFALGEKICKRSSQELLFINLLKNSEDSKTKQDTFWLSSKNNTLTRFEAVYF
ncbi:heat shock protein HslJ [Pedobacter sp. UYEF25]